MTEDDLQARTKTPCFHDVIFWIVTGPDGSGQGPAGVSKGPGMGMSTKLSDGAEEEKSRGGADPEA